MDPVARPLHPCVVNMLKSDFARGPALFAARALTEPLPEGFVERFDPYNTSGLMTVRAFVPSGMTANELLASIEYEDVFPDLTLRDLGEWEEWLSRAQATGELRDTDPVVADILEFETDDKNIHRIRVEARRAIQDGKLQTLLSLLTQIVGLAQQCFETRTLRAKKVGPQPYGLIKPRLDDLQCLLAAWEGGHEPAAQTLDALLYKMAGANGEDPSFCTHKDDNGYAIVWAGAEPLPVHVFLQRFCDNQLVDPALVHFAKTLRTTEPPQFCPAHHVLLKTQAVKIAEAFGVPHDVVAVVPGAQLGDPFEVHIGALVTDEALIRSHQELVGRILDALQDGERPIVPQHVVVRLVGPDELRVEVKSSADSRPEPVAIDTKQLRAIEGTAERPLLEVVREMEAGFK